MTYSDIYNVFRGEAVPSKAEKQEIIGMKSLYWNTFYGFESKKYFPGYCPDMSGISIQAWLNDSTLWKKMATFRKKRKTE